MCVRYSLLRGEGRAGLRSVQRKAAVGNPAWVNSGSKEAGCSLLVPLQQTKNNLYPMKCPCANSVRRVPLPQRVKKCWCALLELPCPQPPPSSAFSAGNTGLHLIHFKEMSPFDEAGLPMTFYKASWEKCFMIKQSWFLPETLPSKISHFWRAGYIFLTFWEGLFKNRAKLQPVKLTPFRFGCYLQFVWLEDAMWYPTIGCPLREAVGWQKESPSKSLMWWAWESVDVKVVEEDCDALI